jgi:arylsulfatase A-like enzyme
MIAAYKKAGIYNQTLFVITADHGMIQSPHRVVDTDAIKKQIVSVLGPNKGIFINGGGKGGPTMTSIWLKNPADNQRLAQAIWNKHYANVSAVYYITNANGQYAYKMAGCESCSTDLVKTYDYLLSTEAGPTGEDVAILLRENARNSGLDVMRGRHGGSDWGSQHVTLIMSGPGVQPGHSQHPARLADLAPTIERFMGITPAARDGIVLADAFQQPNASDVQTQNSSDTSMNVYVNALMARAQSDTKLEAEGKLSNAAPVKVEAGSSPNEQAMAGAAILLGAGIALAWAMAEVTRVRRAG